jgi:IS5 family transposase
MKCNPQNFERNLFFESSDTDTAQLICDAIQFADRHPEILTRILDDQVSHGLAKKRRRLEDDAFNRRQRAKKEIPLPGIPAILPGEDGGLPQDEDLVLQQGRNRIPPLLVFILLTLRGFYGSITDRTAMDRIGESCTLQIVLGHFGWRLPKRSSISENLNCVGEETLDFILKCQLRHAYELNLDDFLETTVDSTASNADMAFPSDTSLVSTSACNLWSILEAVGDRKLIEFAPGACAGKWLRKVRNTSLAISMTACKSGTLYRRRVRELADAAAKLAGKLEPYVIQLNERVRNGGHGDMLAPAWRAFVKLAEMADRNYTATCHSIGQMVSRNLKKRKLKAYEKYLGPADPDAKIIVKGERKPVVGYHPQLARSRGGLVTCVLLDPGTLSDAASLIPTLKQSIENTGVVPRALSADDGYTSADNLDRARQLGVKSVSFSGAKGRKLHGDEEWNSLAMCDLRRSRSAVESLIFTLKHNHEFDRMKRTGLQAVRAEMLEKVLAYNFRRIRKLQAMEEGADGKNPVPGKNGEPPPAAEDSANAKVA